MGKPQQKVTRKAFKGGKNDIRRTSFFKLVKALTVGDEKLVASVDYVKGVFVHDVIDVLQCIIDDRITSLSSNQKALMDKLTILSNFVKNHYKDHVK
jgi:hypothetical protein